MHLNVVAHEHPSRRPQKRRPRLEFLLRSSDKTNVTASASGCNQGGSQNCWPLISEEDANVAPEHRTPSANLRYSRLLPGGSRSTKRIYTAIDGIPSRGSSATHTRRAERVMGFHQPVSARPQTSKGHKKIVGATNR